MPGGGAGLAALTAVAWAEAKRAATEAVRVWVPGVRPSVHVRLARPSASVATGEGVTRPPAVAEA